MNPVERAVAAAVGARRELRDLELGVEPPDAGLVNGEDDEVVRLEVVDVGLVRDGERAALHVALARGVERRALCTGAGPVASVACITTSFDLDEAVSQTEERAHPWEELYQLVAPLSQESSVLILPPAGSSKKSPSLGG